MAEKLSVFVVGAGRDYEGEDVIGVREGLDGAEKLASEKRREMDVGFVWVEHSPGPNYVGPHVKSWRADTQYVWIEKHGVL